MILSRRRTINLLYFILTERKRVIPSRAEGLATGPPRPLSQRERPGRPRHPRTASREVPVPRVDIPGRMIDALWLKAVACDGSEA